MLLTATTLFGWFFLPSFVHVPDGYAIDYERDPPRYAAPVDADNLVSFELLHGALLRGGSLSLRFDEEDRKLGDDGNTVRFRLQWRF